MTYCDDDELAQVLTLYAEVLFCFGKCFWTVMYMMFELSLGFDILQKLIRTGVKLIEFIHATFNFLLSYFFFVTLFCQTLQFYTY